MLSLVSIPMQFCNCMYTVTGRYTKYLGRNVYVCSNLAVENVTHFKLSYQRDKT